VAGTYDSARDRFAILIRLGATNLPSVDLDGPLQVDGVHRTLRSSHPVKRTLTDALLIATGAGGAGVRDLGASGAPLSCDPTFEARAQSGNLDPESKTWIIDTARRFYQDRSRDFPNMPPIGGIARSINRKNRWLRSADLKQRMGLTLTLLAHVCPLRALVQSEHRQISEFSRVPASRALIWSGST
jgi:hypothetical protein